MRVMDQIPREVRQLQNDLSGDVGMSLCWDKNGQAWRGQQSRDELPRRRCAPRPSHDPRVGCHAQKLVEDRPSGVPDTALKQGYSEIGAIAKNSSAAFLRARFLSTRLFERRSIIG